MRFNWQRAWKVLERSSFFAIQLPAVGQFVPKYNPQYFDIDKCSAVARFLERNLYSFPCDKF